ncbi:MAG: hypothetical protein HYZ47_00220 [Simkania negevensis]|nr:hypothetical protein [Simkania negevensis]
MISSLESLKIFLEEKNSSDSVILFFEKPQGFLLSLEKTSSPMEKKGWGKKFIEGFKIDLPSLISERKESAIEEYPLIKRQ